MPGAVILAGARTPIGRLHGALCELPATELGGAAIAAAIGRSGLVGAQVDAVVMGTAVQAGMGPDPARQAASHAGLSPAVAAITVNKLCLSGLHAIALADLLVSSGRCDVVVAGGMESMTRAPALLPAARRECREGAPQAEDALDCDAMVCAFDGISMGKATERYQQGLGISRRDQDAFAARSHRLAAMATWKARLAEEIVPVAGPPRRSAAVEADEGVRPGVTAETLAHLPPAFSPDGTITAGSSASPGDGACALVVSSREYAQRLGVKPWAEIGAYGTAAGPDSSLLSQSAHALMDALRRDGTLKPGDLDLLEINEAYAGIVLHTIRELDIDPERVNVNGGAIALGHPVAMSGARLVLTLALELRHRGGGVGAATLSGGGGQGDALLLHAAPWTP